jgi:hypothetical protein
MRMPIANGNARPIKHILSLAVGAALLSMGVGSAQADTPVNSGNTVDGWTISFPDTITVTSTSNATSLDLDVDLSHDYVSGEGLGITFSQTSYSAAPTISIYSQSVSNNSGSPWSEYQFLLQGEFQGILPDPTFTGAFSQISPFTSAVIDGAGDTITLSGGTFPSGSTYVLGAGGTETTIDAQPSASGLDQSFVMKEDATVGVGSNTPEPAACGLMSVVGLFSLARRRRRRLSRFQI